MKNLRTGFLHTVFWPTLLFLLLAPIALRAASPPVPSKPPARVVDLADIIKPDLERELVSALHELEKKTTAQMAILTVTSLDGQDIESFSLHVAEQWQLGQKGKDNGLLLTVALKDRKYRFETGYGMESMLPDSLLGSIGRKNLVPFFKQGKYDQGIAAATQAVLAVLAKHYNVQLGGMKELQKAEPAIPSHSVQSLYSSIPDIIFLTFFFIIIIGCNNWVIPISIGFCSSLFFSGKTVLILMVFAFLIFNYRRLFTFLIGGSSSDHDSGSSDSSSSSDSDFSGGGGDFGGGGDSGDW